MQRNTGTNSRHCKFTDTKFNCTTFSVCRAECSFVIIFECSFIWSHQVCRTTNKVSVAGSNHIKTFARSIACSACVSYLVFKIRNICSSRIRMESIPLFFKLRIFLCPVIKSLFPFTFKLCTFLCLVFKIFVSFRKNVKILIFRKSKLFLCSFYTIISKWSTVYICSIFFWSPLSNYRFKHNQRRLIFTSFSFVNKLYHAFYIIHITFKNLPAVSFVTFSNVICKCNICTTINRNFVLVIQNNKFSKFKVSGK